MSDFSNHILKLFFIIDFFQYLVLKDYLSRNLNYKYYFPIMNKEYSSLKKINLILV